MSRLLFATLALLLAAGCSRPESASHLSSTEDAAPVEASEELSAAASRTAAPAMSGYMAASTTGTDAYAPPVENGAKIIRTAALRMRVASYETSRAALDELLARHEAYVAAEQESSADIGGYNQFTIRVPAEGFDVLLDDLAGLAEAVEQRRVHAEDVTAQYVDLDARLRTKQEVEKRYYDILNQARNVNEVLAVENQLRQIREEIESMTARLRHLTSRVNYSTIELTLFETPAMKAGPGFMKRAGRAFRSGWLGVLDLLLALIQLWPLWILLALAGPPLYRWRQRREEVAAV